MHAVRSARPKLSLAVPAAAKPAIPSLITPGPAAAGATSSRTSLNVSPLTPTARNTALNARAAHSSTLQIPSFAANAPASRKSASKSVRFAEHESVTLVSPCPQDYYGDYVSMSREERRWTRR